MTVPANYGTKYRFVPFHAKIGILGKHMYLYVSHTLFILYSEENHTLFGK